jgi:tetratricopeptide (TPR) repeat protein
MHSQRRFWEAEQLYKRALKADDRHFDAVYHLGLLYLQQSRYDDATRAFRRAINVDRNSAASHHHLGIALIGLDRIEEAIQRYEKALAIRPDLPETHNNLGHALEMLGRIEDAVAHYEKALAIRPAYAEASNNLGNALLLLGRSEAAIEQFNRALAINPNFIEAQINLGNALVALHRAEEAIACYEQALAVAPNNPRARDLLDHTLRFLGELQEQVEHSQKTGEATPDDANAHNNLGLALQALGRIDEAIQAFERAILVSPRKGSGYLNLVNVRRCTAADLHFAAMRNLARDMGSLDVEDRIAVHFALGKAFADVGDPRQSELHLLEGNKLKRQQITYDATEILVRFERTRAVFTSQLIRDRSSLGDPSSIPVFIIGMPRSGSTLIEQILASHPRVFGAGERNEMAQLVSDMTGADGSRYPEAVAAMSGDELRQSGETYLRAIRGLASEAERIIDKRLSNFELAGFIHLMLPSARFIHTYRDPCDTALSCFATLFTSGLDYTYDLAELGGYYRGYRAMMEHWRRVLPQDAMIEVAYEEVVDDLEGQTRRILAHCGLEWDDACLAFHKTERSVHTASAAQVRQPIYGSSVGRWHAHEDLLQPFVRALEASGV